MRITSTDGDERRRRLSPLLWLASLAAFAVLALGINGTLSQFAAEITNTNNVATSPPTNFQFTETLVDGAGTVCGPAFAGQVRPFAVQCTGINKYGEDGAAATPMVPGASRTTTVTMANTAAAGGLAGALSLNVDPCTQTPPADPVGPPVVGDLCSILTVQVTCDITGDGSPITLPATPASMTAFAAGTPYAFQTLEPGESVDCTFTTAWPAGALDPTLQGISTNQPLTWTFSEVTP